MFADVLSGVPQGSVLGPILFLVFINDVSSVCIGKTNLKLFADDVKLYTSFKIDESNCCSLQKSIDLLSSWANAWQLAINISKCSVLPIRNRYNSSVSHPYFINGTQLVQSTSVSDLGILVDSRLSFNLHISITFSLKLHKDLVYFSVVLFHANSLLSEKHL